MEQELIFTKELHDRWKKHELDSCYEYFSTKHSILIQIVEIWKSVRVYYVDHPSNYNFQTVERIPFDLIEIINSKLEELNK